MNNTSRYDTLRCGTCGVPWKDHTEECSRHRWRAQTEPQATPPIDLQVMVLRYDKPFEPACSPEEWNDLAEPSDGSPTLSDEDKDDETNCLEWFLLAMLAAMFGFIVITAALVLHIILF